MHRQNYNPFERGTTLQSVNFTLPYMNQSGDFQLADYKGKIVVLTFWVSWCPDCSADLPKKEQLYRSMDVEKVKMVTINVTGRERNEIDGMNYCNKFLTQPTLKDRGREVYDLFGCEGVPATIIINQQGEIFSSFGEQSTMMEVVTAIGELL